MVSTSSTSEGLRANSCSQPQWLIEVIEVMDLGADDDLKVSGVVGASDAKLSNATIKLRDTREACNSAYLIPLTSAACFLQGPIFPRSMSMDDAADLMQARRFTPAWPLVCDERDCVDLQAWLPVAPTSCCPRL
nr:hypothetical protein CFP56_09320 [Quercus suber]